MRLLVSLFCLLTTACAARAATLATEVDRMAELDRHHGFQDLDFDSHCAQVKPAGEVEKGPYGLEVFAVERAVMLAGVQHPRITAGCYKGRLSQVVIPIEGNGAIRRVRSQLVRLYGAPGLDPARPGVEVWSGERVELTLDVDEASKTAQVSFRSLLSEALWRRDMALQEKRAPMPRDPEPTVFRTREDGVY